MTGSTVLSSAIPPLSSGGMNGIHSSGGYRKGQYGGAGAEYGHSNRHHDVNINGHHNEPGRMNGVTYDSNGNAHDDAAESNDRPDVKRQKLDERNSVNHIKNNRANADTQQNGEKQHDGVNGVMLNGEKKNDNDNDAGRDETLDADKLNELNQQLIAAKAELERLDGWHAKAQAELAFLKQLASTTPANDASKDAAANAAATLPSIDLLANTDAYTAAAQQDHYQSLQQQQLQLLQEQQKPTSYLQFEQAYAPPLNDSLMDPAVKALADAQRNAVSRVDAVKKSRTSLFTGQTYSNQLDELLRRRDEVDEGIRLFQATAGRKLERGNEPPRNKTHWDYMCAEMQWMSNDFSCERKLKMNVAKHLAYDVQKWHQQHDTAAWKEIQAERESIKQINQNRKQQIHDYWKSVAKLVYHKHNQTVPAVEHRKQRIIARLKAESDRLLLKNEDEIAASSKSTDKTGQLALPAATSDSTSATTDSSSERKSSDDGEVKVISSSTETSSQSQRNDSDVIVVKQEGKEQAEPSSADKAVAPAVRKRKVVKMHVNGFSYRYDAVEEDDPTAPVVKTETDANGNQIVIQQPAVMPPAPYIPADQRLTMNLRQKQYLYRAWAATLKQQGYEVLFDIIPAPLAPPYEEWIFARNDHLPIDTSLEKNKSLALFVYPADIARMLGPLSRASVERYNKPTSMISKSQAVTGHVKTLRDTSGQPSVIKISVTRIAHYKKRGFINIIQKKSKTNATVAGSAGGTSQQQQQKPKAVNSLDRERIRQQLSRSTNVVAVSPHQLREAMRERIGLPWTSGEDNLLLSLIGAYNTNWLIVSFALANITRVCGRLRSARDCYLRYQLLVGMKDPKMYITPTSTITTATVQPSGQTTAHAYAPQAVSSAAGATSQQDMVAAGDKRKKGQRGMDSRNASMGGGMLPKKDGLRGDRKRSNSIVGMPDGRDTRYSSSQQQYNAASSSTYPSSSSVSTAREPLGFGGGIYQFIDQGVFRIKRDRAYIQHSLKLQLPALGGEDLQGKVINVQHSTHKSALIEAHSRLALPPQAVGKTLMPHQIIQLRQRRQQQLQAIAQAQQAAAQAQHQAALAARQQAAAAADPKNAPQQAAQGPPQAPTQPQQPGSAQSVQPLPNVQPSSAQQLVSAGPQLPAAAQQPQQLLPPNQLSHQPSVSPQAIIPPTQTQGQQQPPPQQQHRYPTNPQQAPQAQPLQGQAQQYQAPHPSQQRQTSAASVGPRQQSTQGQATPQQPHMLPQGVINAQQQLPHQPSPVPIRGVSGGQSGGQMPMQQQMPSSMSALPPSAQQVIYGNQSRAAATPSPTPTQYSQATQPSAYNSPYQTQQPQPHPQYQQSSRAPPQQQGHPHHPQQQAMNQNPQQQAAQQQYYNNRAGSPVKLSSRGTSAQSMQALPPNAAATLSPNQQLYNQYPNTGGGAGYSQPSSANLQQPPPQQQQQGSYSHYPSPQQQGNMPSSQQQYAQQQAPPYQRQPSTHSTGGYAPQQQGPPMQQQQQQQSGYNTRQHAPPPQSQASPPAQYSQYSTRGSMQAQNPNPQQQYGGQAPMQQQQPNYQQQGQQPPSRGSYERAQSSASSASGMGIDMHNPQSMQLLKYLMNSVPHLREEVESILKRGDLSQDMKTEHITQVFRAANLQHPNSGTQSAYHQYTSSLAPHMASSNTSVQHIPSSHSQQISQTLAQQVGQLLAGGYGAS